MDHVVKRSLGRLMAEDGLVPLPRVVDLVGQIADALQKARTQGIVLCDLQPDAILLEQQEGGALRVTGFGEPDERLASGAAGGGSRYMAPEEQVAGSHDADERADQFSLAAIAYEMLSGCSPFTEDDLEKADDSGARVIPPRRPPPALAELVVGLPPSLDDVFRRAMSFQPGERFARIDDFTASLRAISEGRTPGPVLVSSGPITAKVPVRREAGGVGSWMRSLGGRGRTRTPAYGLDDRLPPPMAAPLPTDVPAMTLGPEPPPPDLRAGKRAPLLVVAAGAVIVGGVLAASSYRWDSSGTRNPMRSSASAATVSPPPAPAPVPTAAVRLPDAPPAPEPPAPPAAAPTKVTIAAAPAAVLGKHHRPAHSRRHHGATLRSAGNRH